MVSKKIIIFGLALTVAGVFVTGGGLVAGGKPGYYMDRSGIHTASRRNSAFVMEKEKLEEFRNISLRVEYADINLIPSDGYYLEYRLSGNAQEPAVRVENGTFTMEEQDAASGISFFLGISFDSWGNEDDYYVNLYYPESAELENVKISSGDGDVSIDSLNAQTFAVNTQYGDLKLGEIKSPEISLEMEDGELETELLEAENLEAHTEYGDIKIKEMQAAQAKITLSDGDFRADTVSAEKLDIADQYGSVTLGLKDWDKATLSLSTDYGSLKLPQNQTLEEDDEEVSYSQEGTAAAQVKITCGDGDITLVEP